MQVDFGSVEETGNLQIGGEKMWVPAKKITGRHQMGGLFRANWQLFCGSGTFGRFARVALTMHVAVVVRGYMDEGAWQELVHNRYRHSKALSQVKSKLSGSTFGRVSGRSKMTIFHRGLFEVRTIESTRFWEYTWLRELPCLHSYPSL
jgi:hypothetical protein